MKAQPEDGQGEILAMSLAFMISAVVLTVVGNVVILRYFLTRPLDTPFEDN
jgi:hypothetical protein